MATVTDCEVTLQGSFLDSVERSEISVTVSGEPCTERQAAEDDVNTVRIFTSKFKKLSIVEGHIGIA